MLYWLLYLKLYHYFPPFRIFRYLTFRTAFASLTALFTGLIVGPNVIERLREFQDLTTGEGQELFAPEISHDTVGAVALDNSGNIAAATSTGGTLNKAPGRLGDARFGDPLGRGLRVLIENTAGAEYSLGGSFEQVAEVLECLQGLVPVAACGDTAPSGPTFSDPTLVSMPPECACCTDDEGDACSPDAGDAAHDVRGVADAEAER